MRRHLLVLMSAFVVMAGLALPVGPAQAARTVDPSRIDATAGHDQVIVVQAGNRSTTYAWLTLWTRVRGTWVATYGPVSARLGWNGLSDRAVGDRRQGDGTTPTGVYSLPFTFGTHPNPGTSMRWTRIDKDDYWSLDPKDPKTYNSYQYTRTRQARWRTGSWSEPMLKYPAQFEYGVLIGFNYPKGLHLVNKQMVTSTPANIRKGGGIFLHVNARGATAGCVSIPRAQMRTVVRWLDPAKKPVIAIGTPAILDAL